MPEGSETATLTPKFSLEVGGAQVDAVLAESVIVIRVMQHTELADALELKLANDELEWSESDTLAEGTEIAISLGYEEGELEKVFTGEVVRRECVFPERGPTTVTVIAFDKEHKLKQGRNSKTWLGTKSSDIVSELAGEVGLSADVEATQTAHRYMFQQDKSNLAFIRDLAARDGYVVQVDRENTKLTFKKPQESDNVATLAWGGKLLEFRPRMTTDKQVSKVTVRGWDMTTKQKIEGSADTSKITLALDGADKGADLAGDAEVLFTDIPIHEQPEAEARAASLINAAAKGYCQADGVAEGDPKLVPGAAVTIEAVGKRAGGGYFLESVIHHLEPQVGYTSRFVAIRSTESKEPGEREELPEAAPGKGGEEQQAPLKIKITVRTLTGEPVEGRSYTVTLPDGKQEKGTLDETGVIEIEGIKDPGDAKIELDPPEETEAVES